jgi:hypothetical protein
MLRADCLSLGQRAIIESCLEFARHKSAAAIDSAKQAGVDLVFEDEESE